MALEDVLVAATVRPVHIGWLDFKDDPARGWTGSGTLLPAGTGDADLDGETFSSAEGAVEITAFTQNRGLGGPVTVTFAAGEMQSESVVTQLVADRRAFQGRKARFWLGFLNAAESAILPEIEPMFTGVMTNAETRRETGQPSTISVTCDQDTQKANGPPLRWIDHQSFYAGDTATSYINNLARGGIAAVPSGASAPSVPPATEPYPGYNDQYLFPMPGSQA